MACIVKTKQGTWRCLLSIKGVRDTKTFDTKEAAELWGVARGAEIRKKASLPVYTDKFEAAQSLLATNVPRRVLNALAKIPHTAHEILEAGIPVGNLMGLYFLIKDQEVIYVGQSTDVLARVSKHRRNGKEFDAFSFIHCMDQAKLDDLEATYILALVPILNLSMGRIPAGATIYED